MAQIVKVWFDKGGDFREDRFSEKPGYMRETDNEAVMERVSDQGEVLGFSVMAAGKLDKDHPLVAQLASASPATDDSRHPIVKEDPPKPE